METRTQLKIEEALNKEEQDKAIQAGNDKRIETKIITLEENIFEELKELVVPTQENSDDEQQKEFEQNFKLPIFFPSKTELDNNTTKYQFIKIGGDKLTYAEFIDLLKTKNEDFLRAFREELKEIGLEIGGYFWECVPVTKNDTNRKFEFVVVKSAALDNIRQNYSDFQEHIDESKDKLACSFPNLGGDATLIIPLPKKKGSNELDYKNLKEFSDNAPEKQ
ncbi:22567_t:CDS:2 [Entrophospora sp. SA101]|nr:347_t:CDS:2 [Entrophospora sp. SA101]CAJ0748214.1 22567_t:CDS:2 [Entrophospora sp. SA101]CAJ0844610.1 4036_t:CDS:2 [Entrophospora sp. SA101]CAJ0881185.1 20773_t:CDS:2 [Entrophospora sp. SA101]